MSLSVMHTIVGVLSRDFGHGIANLLPNVGDGFTSQASNQLLTDHQALFTGKCREEFLGFVCDGVLSCLGRYSSEKYRRERACLRSR